LEPETPRATAPLLKELEEPAEALEVVVPVAAGCDAAGELAVVAGSVGLMLESVPMEVADEIDTLDVPVCEDVGRSAMVNSDDCEKILPSLPISTKSI